MSNAGQEGPFAFLSSVFQDPKGAQLKVRERLIELGEKNGRPFWTAEQHMIEDAWNRLPPLQRVDECLEHVRQTDIFVCILHSRHGSGIEADAARECWHASYFEMEIFEAALLNKPIFIFQMADFEPRQETKLTEVLRILHASLPGTIQRCRSDDELVERVERILASDIKPGSLLSPVRRRSGSIARLEGCLAAARSEAVWDVRRAPPLQFLDGLFEAGRQPPRKDLIEEIIEEARNAKDQQRRLTRLWIAIRELMAEPYATTKQIEFLAYWNEVLDRWVAAGAWYGLHGHLYMGCLAALGSVFRVRQRIADAKHPSDPQLRLPPHGPMASEIYSIAKLLPAGKRRRETLTLARTHVDAALEHGIGDRSGYRAIRGSINLALGDFTTAIEDYDAVLHMRRGEGESEGRIGEAESELGFAYLRKRSFGTGLRYLESGVQHLVNGGGGAGFIVRAKRKLAAGYIVTGKFDHALSELSEAYQLAQDNRLDDQITPLMALAARLKRKRIDIPPDLDRHA